MFNKYLVIAVVALGLSVAFFFNKWREAQSQVGQLADYAVAKDSEANFYKNAFGHEVSKSEAIQMDYDAFRQIASDRDLAYLKEFEGLKKSLRNLEVATNINSRAVADIKATGKDTKVLVDSVYHPGFEFEKKDEWMTVKGTVVPELKLVDFHLEMEVAIQGALFWERKKILGLRIGKKTWKSEFTSPNPHVHITKTDQLLIRRK